MVCVRVRVCTCLYTQAPHARGGASLKDGANLPLATLCVTGILRVTMMPLTFGGAPITKSWCLTQRKHPYV